MKKNKFILLLFVVIPLVFFTACTGDTSVFEPIVSTGQKTRLIVLADMGHDPDEEQQITHLLMCSNEMDIEGLIAVTGRFYRRDPNLIVKDLRPQLFHHLIDGYEEVLGNLKRHASGWPEPEYLRSIVAKGQPGNGMVDTGPDKSSAGSRRIVAALKKDDPRPVYIVVNSGANTLAQALLDIQATYTPAEQKRLLARMLVYDNAGQDEAGAWICHTFPDIHYVRSVNQTKAFGGPSNNNLGPHVWKPYPYSPEGQHQWAKEHIQTNHGALGILYPDRIVGGYHFLEGGGTIPWMGLVNRGLSDPSRPWWGGWSGRYSCQKQLNVPANHRVVREDEKAYRPYRVYSDHSGISDRWTDPDSGQTYDDVHAAVWRWRQAMWNDLQCRMDWCVKPYEKANHHPVAFLNGDGSDAILQMNAKPGQDFRLDASDSYDPDGDKLSFFWTIYPEAGTYSGRVEISETQAAITNITIPDDTAGSEIHLILEVRDNSPIAALSDYRRLVFFIDK